MTARSRDTSIDAEEMQIALFKKAKIPRRIACMRSFSNTVIQLSRRAILRAQPSYTEQELDVAFIKLHYGEELTEHFENCLNR